MMKKSGFVESDNITLLAKGVLLRGEIHARWKAPSIDGRLEGDLQTAGTVVIGEDGWCRAPLPARTIISSGRSRRRSGDGTTAIAQDWDPRWRSAVAPAFSMEDGAKVPRHVGHGRVVLGGGCAEASR